MCYYYPGFVLTYKTVRDPAPKIIKGFFPSIILGLFLICTFQLEPDALNDRLANLSICLLAYVAVLEQMRSNLPEISSMTIGDKFLVSYIVTSCFPVVYMFGRFIDDTDPVKTLEAQK